MRDRGDHGIGTAEEAHALDLVEQAVIARAAELSVIYVGRLRTRGIWETVLYGPAGHLEALRRAARDHAGSRRFDARSADDPSWSCYRELLLPDAERRQWMDDRRMVQILAEQGDRLATPRRVDHELTVPAAEARTKLLAVATAAGFVVDEEDAATGRVRLHRDDAIELEHIHEVVMLLVDAAEGGSYLRWQAGIVAS